MTKKIFSAYFSATNITGNQNQCRIMYYGNTTQGALKWFQRDVVLELHSKIQYNFCYQCCVKVPQ